MVIHKVYCKKTDSESIKPNKLPLFVLVRGKKLPPSHNLLVNGIARRNHRQNVLIAVYVGFNQRSPSGGQFFRSGVERLLERLPVTRAKALNAVSVAEF
jgi:hypothetical protein